MGSLPLALLRALEVFSMYLLNDGAETKCQPSGWFDLTYPIISLIRPHDVNKIVGHLLSIFRIFSSLVLENSKLS